MPALVVTTTSKKNNSRPGAKVPAPIPKAPRANIPKQMISILEAETRSAMIPARIATTGRTHKLRVPI